MFHSLFAVSTELKELVIKLIGTYENEEPFFAKKYLLLTVPSNITIANLKRKVEETLQISFESLLFSFCGSILNDQKAHLPIDVFEDEVFVNDDYQIFRPRLCLMLRSDCEFEGPEDQALTPANPSSIDLLLKPEDQPIEQIPIDAELIKDTKSNSDFDSKQHFHLERELELINCAHFSPLLSSNGYNDESAFAHLVADDFVDTSKLNRGDNSLQRMIVPQRAKQRILELASVLKHRLETKDVLGSVNEKKNVERQLLESNVINTVTLDGMDTGIQFTKKSDANRAWEKKVSEDRRKSSIRNQKKNESKEKDEEDVKGLGSDLKKKIMSIRWYFDILKSYCSLSIDNDIGFVRRCDQLAKLSYGSDVIKMNVVIDPSRPSKRLGMEEVEPIELTKKTEIQSNSKSSIYKMLREHNAMNSLIQSKELKLKSHSLVIPGNHDQSMQHAVPDNSLKLRKLRSLYHSHHVEMLNHYFHPMESLKTHCCDPHAMLCNLSKEVYLYQRKLQTISEIEIYLNELESYRVNQSVSKKILHHIALKILKSNRYCYEAFVLHEESIMKSIQELIKRCKMKGLDWSKIKQLIHEGGGMGNGGKGYLISIERSCGCQIDGIVGIKSIYNGKQFISEMTSLTEEMDRQIVMKHQYQTIE